MTKDNNKSKEDMVDEIVNDEIVEDNSKDIIDFPDLNQEPASDSHHLDSEFSDQDASKPVDDIKAEENKPSELEVLKQENEELQDRVLRLQAEITNIQRRNTRDKQNDAKYRSQKLASELLDVVDNLERALATQVTTDDALALNQGVEMVYKQFLTAFEKEGIQIIDPIGQEFDPNLHQAVSMMPGNEDQPTNTVMNVLQKGYQLNDRILRPAMVIVAE